MEFRILGPLEVVHEGRTLELGASKERALLALLLLDAGRVVSVDRLIEDLWEGDPPESASVSLRVHVSRLRKSLAPAGGDELIVTRSPGYVAMVGRQQLDAARFDMLVTRGREQAAAGALEAAAASYDEALSMWRGAALADVLGAPFAQAEAARLEEARLASLEDRVDVELRLGRHRKLVAELEALVAANPLRERLWAARMVALYRSGRQADALRSFQELRSHLIDELGIEPSPALVELERAVLAQDDDLLGGPGHAPPARPLPSGVITFLLTDIEDSAGHWDHAPKAMAAALDHHDALIAAAVIAHDGTLMKTKGEGDSTLSVFTRASGAVAAALDAQQRLADATWPGDLALRVRMAVHTGEAHERDGDYFGPSVNRTARLRDLADGGQVLASSATAELVRDRLPEGAALLELGHHRLRGINQPEWVFAVVEGAAAATATVEVPLPGPLVALDDDPFVDRAAEMAMFRELWDDIRTRGARAVLVCGEPGIGKSRLVARVAAEAREAGGTVLYGRCDEGLAVPYQPFVDALRAYVAALPPGVVRAQAGHAAADLARLVPEVREKLPGLAAPATTEPDAERYLLFDAVATIVRAAAERGPVMLVFEDLHWAARPTLLLLRHVVRALGLDAVAILATYRDTDVHLNSDLDELLADLHRDSHVDRLTLGGLDIASVAKLVGDEPGAEEVARAIHAETDGNPLWVMELLAHLATGERRPAELPQGVRDGIQRRLGQLSPTTQRVLASASVVGREFDLWVVEQLLDGVSGDDVVDAVEEALAAKLLIEVPGRAGRVTFTHSLVRQAVAENLSAVRRARMHWRIARALDERADSSTRLTEIAQHALAGVAVSGDVDWAVESAVRAAQRASSALAHEQAADLYRQALEIADPDDAGRRCDLLLAQAEADALAGDGRRADETFAIAAELARAIGDPERLARAALRTGQLQHFGVPAPDPEQVGLLESARRGLGPEPSELLVLVLTRMALLLAYSHERTRAGDLARDAVAMARELGERRALGAALLAQLNTSLSSGQIAHRLAIAEEVSQLAEECGDDPLALHGAMWRAHTLLAVGHIEAYTRAVERFSDLAERARLPVYLAQARMYASTGALIRGDTAHGEALANDALLMGAQHSGLVLQLYGAQMLWTWWQQGRLPALANEFAEIINQSPGSFPAVRAARALMAAETGDIDSAAREVEELASDDFAGLVDGPTGTSSAALLASVIAALDDGTKAGLLAERLAPLAGTVLLAGPSSAGCLGPADHHIGLLLATAGRGTEARQHLRTAVALADAMGSPPFSAAASVELARVLSSGDDEERAEAAVLLEGASATARRLGLARLAAQADALTR